MKTKEVGSEDEPPESRSGHLINSAPLTKERNGGGGACRFVGVETKLHFGHIQCEVAIWNI